MHPSAGSAGDPCANALPEPVIGLFKTEVIRLDGPLKALESVEYVTLEGVDWFNKQFILGHRFFRLDSVFGQFKIYWKTMAFSIHPKPADLQHNPVFALRYYKMCGILAYKITFYTKKPCKIILFGLIFLN